MTRYLGSLRFRLLAALFLLVFVAALGIFLNNRTATQAQDARRQVKAIGDQETNVYLLASLARRLDSINDEAEQQSTLTLIQNNIQNFEMTQSALRNGNEGLQLKPFHGQELLAALGEMDARWANYRSLLERFVKADPAARTQLEPQIDAQSATVFAFAVRVDKYLDVTIEQDTQSARQILIVLVGIAVLVTLFAVYVIMQIIRSTNALANTASQLATGNLKARAGTSGITEIDGLGKVLNNMAEQIETRIVETEAARASAERSNQVKSAFLASMSYELRTPLNAIMTFTELISMGTLGPVNEEQVEYLQKSLQSSKHLLSLINDVLDITKIQSGMMKLFVEGDFDVPSEMASLASSAEKLLKDKPVKLVLDVDSSFLPLTCDKRRVRQVLLNLISNAIKFTEQGTITLSAKNHDQEVLFVVSDTGPGITKDEQEIIFEPFIQTETGIRHAGGTGLGLPISKHFTEAHGGRLWVESELGQGSAFFVALSLRSDLKLGEQEM